MGATAGFLLPFHLSMTVKTKYIPYISREMTTFGEEMAPEAPAGLQKTYFFYKRCFDLTFSTLVIFGILSWLLPLIGILIKLDSGGPVFFLQKRIGKDGKWFTCYKLRTMVVNDQADECPVSEDDKRITRLGKFLRGTHLDELPQFFNVLSGSMSVVGPRPYMSSDWQRFSAIVPGYSFRNSVKPGITGLAQVKRLHGPVTDMQTIFLRCHWDSFYVRNAGFLFDLRILRQTVRLFPEIVVNLKDNVCT